MKRASMLSAILFAYAVAVFAGKTDPPPPLSQRIDVNLVNVDVTVLDAGGRAVRGLTQEDFEIFEDGVRQKITNFSAVQEDNEVAARSADATPDPERRRSIVLLIDKRDFFNGPLRSRLCLALMRLLDETFDDSQWSIVTLQEDVRTETPFTTDRKLLHDTLDALRRGVPAPQRGPAHIVAEELSLASTFAMPEPDCPSGECIVRAFQSGVDAAQQILSHRSFYGAVIATARGLAWMPGKKTILIVSSSVPGYVAPENAAAANAAIEAALRHGAMVREANAANASIFVLDPAGVSGDFNIAHGGTGFKARTTSGALWLASLTGGQFLPSNRMDQSLASFENATTNYYELGYHTSSRDASYHTIDVRVARAGRYTISHRGGFLKLSRDAAFERSLLTPFGLASQKNTLPISLTIGDPEPAKEGKLVPIRATIPLSRTMFLHRADGDIGRLHFYVSVFDDSGAVVVFQHFAETITDAVKAKSAKLVIARGIPLTKGTYRLFVIVRDELSEEVGIAAKEIGL